MIETKLLTLTAQGCFPRHVMATLVSAKNGAEVEILGAPIGVKRVALVMLYGHEWNWRPEYWTYPQWQNAHRYILNHWSEVEHGQTLDTDALLQQAREAKEQVA